jgi:hypothetical protein
MMIKIRISHIYLFRGGGGGGARGGAARAAQTTPPHKGGRNTCLRSRSHRTWQAAAGWAVSHVLIVRKIATAWCLPLGFQRPHRFVMCCLISAAGHAILSVRQNKIVATYRSSGFFSSGVWHHSSLWQVTLEKKPSTILNLGWCDISFVGIFHLKCDTTARSDKSHGKKPSTILTLGWCNCLSSGFFFQSLTPQLDLASHMGKKASTIMTLGWCNITFVGDFLLEFDITVRSDKSRWKKELHNPEFRLVQHIFSNECFEGRLHT